MKSLSLSHALGTTRAKACAGRCGSRATTSASASSSKTFQVSRCQSLISSRPRTLSCSCCSCSCSCSSFPSTSKFFQVLPSFSHARWSVSARATSQGEAETAEKTISGKAYVTRDNIDTDQIIPAEWLMLVPSKPDELELLGAHAMEGLPMDQYPERYITEGSQKSEYKIIIGGENFGCGSSREHAPICIAAAGTSAIIAQSYARIFFRNCISTGEIYPCEVPLRLCEEVNTGDELTVNLDRNLLINHTQGKEYDMNPLGSVKPVIDAGGIFEYARKIGMVDKE